MGKGLYLLTVLCTYVYYATTTESQLTSLIFSTSCCGSLLSPLPLVHTENGTRSCPLYALCVCAITHVLEEAKGGKFCELFPFLCLSSNLCVS